MSVDSEPAVHKPRGFNHANFGEDDRTDGAEIREDDEAVIGEDSEAEMGKDNGIEMEEDNGIEMGEDNGIETGEDNGIETGEGESTPQPRKQGKRQYVVAHDADDDNEHDNEPFQTPVALCRKNWEVTEGAEEWRYMTKGYDLKQKEKVKHKRDQIGGVVDDSKKGTKGEMFGNKVGVTLVDASLSHCSV
jgi:hypothetical protein